MPIETQIRVYLPIPTSKPNKWKEEAEKGVIRPVIRPDVENMIKGIHDALNGLAYYDDRQIVKTTVEKWYSSEPRVEVQIEGDWF